MKGSGNPKDQGLVGQNNELTQPVFNTKVQTGESFT
jgi:hypothetical protein